jgi:hypothetical protein
MFADADDLTGGCSVCWLTAEGGAAEEGRLGLDADDVGETAVQMMTSPSVESMVDDSAREVVDDRKFQPAQTKSGRILGDGTARDELRLHCVLRDLPCRVLTMKLALMTYVCPRRKSLIYQAREVILADASELFSQRVNR